MGKIGNLDPKMIFDAETCMESGFLWDETEKRCMPKIRWKDINEDIVYMSPSSFLARVPHPAIEGIPALIGLEEETTRIKKGEKPKYYAKSSIDYIKRQIEKRKKLEPLYLDYTQMWYGFPTHEGRHRAFVAISLGEKEVPVKVIK